MSGLNLSEWAVRRPTLMLFLMIAIVIAGTMSYFKLGRAEDPSFTIKIAVVTAYWPGATSKDMRDQLEEVLEKKIQELPFLDKIETYVKPGFLAMQIVLKDDTPAKEVPTLFYQLRKKLYDVKPALPQGVIGPNVNDEYGDVDTVLYAISGPGVDYQMLDKVVERMRQKLLEVPDATKIDVVGKQPRRIYVEFSEAKIANLGIEPQAIFDSLAKQNTVSDAGVFETPSSRVRVIVT
ncbi:MAG: efflux RND transporter permease subunit, partial [Methylocystis sp.]